MNLDLQQELLRRYPKIFRKPPRRPVPAIALAETSDTPGTHSEKERTPHPGTDTPFPYVERPGWTVFDERGLECGDGWFDIIDRLARVFETEIETMIASGTPKSRWPRIRHCKEKLGSLRFYVSFPGGIPDRVRQHLLAAEAESRRICEACGKEKREDQTSQPISICERCNGAAHGENWRVHLARVMMYRPNTIVLNRILNGRQD